jgi:alpha-galactosidase
LSSRAIGHLPFGFRHPFGVSPQGRALSLVIVSKDHAFTPEAARRTGKPIMLVQNSIHAGEVDGTDASMALVRDMAVSPGFAGSRVCLMDIDAGKIEVMAALARKIAAQKGAPARIEATTDRRRALDGADYVVVSIEHGNRAETWKQDYYVPIRHGSRQVYGENGGAGGAFHTWRQVGPLLALARAMERSCPEAWLLNYSNPVPRLTWALDRATRIRNVGLCHGIGGALGARGERSRHLPHSLFQDPQR